MLRLIADKVTARRRAPPESINHSGKASGEAAEGVDSRRLVDLGRELVRHTIPVSLVYLGHIPARDVCPASREGHGYSLESPAAEAPV